MSYRGAVSGYGGEAAGAAIEGGLGRRNSIAATKTITSWITAACWACENVQKIFSAPTNISQFRSWERF